MNNIDKMIYNELILSFAVNYVGNLAQHEVGYNFLYHLPSSLFASASTDGLGDMLDAPGIAVEYDLLDKGPDRIYDDQYRAQAEAEYGNLIDPTKENLSEHDLFWAMERAYKRISVYEVFRASSGEGKKDERVLVRRVEGKCGMRCSYHRDGSWMDRIVALYKTSSEYHFINPTGEEPVWEEEK